MEDNFAIFEDINPLFDFEPLSFSWDFNLDIPKLQELYKGEVTFPGIEPLNTDVNLIFKPEKEERKELVKNEISNKTKKIVNKMKGSYSDKNKWVTDLKSAYRKAGITNENAITMLVAQDALESRWGKSVLGRFNYGNITPGKLWKGEIVNGKDKNGKGEPISQKFRSYNSMDEYAIDKVQFLKRLYDFDENDDINTFVHKLQGDNKGKRRYAESPTYINSVIKVYKSIS